MSRATGDRVSGSTGTASGERSWFWSGWAGGCCLGARDSDNESLISASGRQPPTPTAKGRIVAGRAASGSAGKAARASKAHAPPQLPAAALRSVDEDEWLRQRSRRSWFVCCRRRLPGTRHFQDLIVRSGGLGSEDVSLAQSSAEAEDKDAGLLRDLRRALGPSGLERLKQVLVPGESEDECMLRFLRARDMRVGAAADMLFKDLTWRLSNDIRSLPDKSLTEIVGCEESIITKNIPVWHQGFDTEGQPVMFKHYGTTNMNELMAHTTIDALELLHIREAESVARLCAEQSQKLGKTVSKGVFVVDCEGWCPSNLRNPAAMSYGKKMAVVDQDHYPERLSRMVLINVPRVVVIFWTMVSVLLDAKTKKKVQLASSRQQWEPILVDMLGGVENVPPQYRPLAK